jgi:hypothetical protein
MAIHKLSLEDFDEADYGLLAIHSIYEDYRLAYKINQKLGVSLFKNDKDISVNMQGNTVFFPRFTYTDQENILIWDLVQNSQVLEQQLQKKAVDLFDNNNFSRKIYLVSELSKADFLLKIELNTATVLTEIIKKINKIDAVSAVYQVNINELKSKNNLIF